jgi:hypothetical protein
MDETRVNRTLVSQGTVDGKKMGIEKEAPDVKSPMI